MNKQMDDPLCPICKRPLAEPNESRRSRRDRGVVAQTEHHMVPKSRGGKAEVKLTMCVDCHSAIHAFFDNKQLEKDYHTVEALITDERFAKAIQFIAKQPPGKRHKTKRTKERQKQNKYR
jgi:hypothetical protein